jgi:hypothetical protein
MDSKKLARIIKLIVEQELKKQLPKLVKEGVAKALNENKQVSRKKQQEPETDMFSLANAILENERKDEAPKKTFSKNALLNQVLNETRPFKEGSALHENHRNMDKTIGLDSNGAPGGIDAIRSQMAAKMGYGDMGGKGASPSGLGVQTGVPVMDKVLNRDYSELVKRFKK